MPDPALPEPRQRSVPGAVPFTRTWVDALGQPLSGTVTLTGKTRVDLGGVSVLPAPVSVQLAGGVLDVRLPPGTYRFEADLRTTAGVKVTDAGTITVS